MYIHSSHGVVDAGPGLLPHVIGEILAFVDFSRAGVGLMTRLTGAALWLTIYSSIMLLLRGVLLFLKSLR